MHPNLREWLYDYAVSAYEAERQSIHKIRDSASNLIALMITPGLAIDAYLALNLRGGTPFTILLNYYFWTPWLVSIALLLYAAVVVACKILKPENLSRVPPPSEILDYQKKRVNDNSKNVLKDIQEGLLEEYATSHNVNFKVIQNKQAKLIHAQKYALVAFVFITFSLFRWGYNFYSNDQEKLPVKILPIPMDSYQKDTQMATNNSAPVSQTKPVFPQSRMAMDSAAPNTMPTFPQSRMALGSSEPKTKPAFPQSKIVLENFDPLAKNKKTQ